MQQEKQSFFRMSAVIKIISLVIEEQWVFPVFVCPPEKKEPHMFNRSLGGHTAQTGLDPVRPIQWMWRHHGVFVKESASEGGVQVVTAQIRVNIHKLLLVLLQYKHVWLLVAFFDEHDSGTCTNHHACHKKHFDHCSMALHESLETLLSHL